ncbi:MAG: hypothetical protein AAB392_01065 [Patescibacteria group bacterium]
MIRRILGLGLAILLLKFLMKSVFVAGENAFITLLNTAGVLFSNMGNIGTGVNVDHLVPR